MYRPILKETNITPLIKSDERKKIKSEITIRNYIDSVTLFIKNNIKTILLLLFIILIAVGLSKFWNWYVIGSVNGQKITRIMLWQKMENSYGNQVREDIINQMIIDSELEKIIIDKNELNSAYQELDDKIKSSPTLENSLLSKGVTKENLYKQIETDLKVRKLLITDYLPSDDEILTEFNEYELTLYKDRSIDQSRDEIIKKLIEEKFQKEYSDWLSRIKQEAQVERSESL